MKKIRLKNLSMFKLMLRHFPTFVFGELLLELLGNLVAYVATVLYSKSQIWRTAAVPHPVISLNRLIIPL